MTSVLHPHNRNKQKLLRALKAFRSYPLFFTFQCSSALEIIALLLVPLFWVNSFFYLLLHPCPVLLLPSPPSLSPRGLSVGMRERGEWGRQALSWLSWEPLAPRVLGPVLPPLSINLQWQLHCLPNPPRILGDDWSAPLCSINLWPPALRHQSQAPGSGLTRPGQPVGHLSDVRDIPPVTRRQSVHVDVSQLVLFIVTPHLPSVYMSFTLDPNKKI